MDEDILSKPVTNLELEKAKQNWEEYRYRHEHVWGLIFKITTAVVAVSIIPYILKPETEEKLGCFILALPLIGLALTLISALRLSEECSLLSENRKRHREFYNLKVNNSSFTKHVMIYLGSLIILGIFNVGVVSTNNFSCHRFFLFF
jgi:hypothetical protein